MVKRESRYLFSIMGSMTMWSAILLWIMFSTTLPPFSSKWSIVLKLEVMQFLRPKSDSMVKISTRPKLRNWKNKDCGNSKRIINFTNIVKPIFFNWIRIKAWIKGRNCFHLLNHWKRIRINYNTKTELCLDNGKAQWNRD